mgnify:CR=1 FL=1|jgi:hypothetical protein
MKTDRRPDGNLHSAADLMPEVYPSRPRRREGAVVALGKGFVFGLLFVFGVVVLLLFH